MTVHRAGVDAIDESVAGLLVRAREASFFALVEQLERRLHGPRVGRAAGTEVPIRFRHSPRLSFSEGDVEEARCVPLSHGRASARTRVEITTTFLGLVGAATPLPLYFAEEVWSDLEEGGVRSRFLDLFHHRILELLYRLCRRYRLGSIVDAPASDPWSRRLRALGGVGAAGDEARAERGVPEGTEGLPEPAARVRLVPLLLLGRRSARSLQAALRHVLRCQLGDVSVHVRELAGCWTEIDPQEHMALGRRRTRLGKDALCGGRVRDPAARLAVVVGPVDDRGYRRLQPGGDLHDVLAGIAREFVGNSTDVDVEVRLGDACGAVLRLGDADLGRNSWLSGVDKRGGGRVRFAAHEGPVCRQRSA